MTTTATKNTTELGAIGEDITALRRDLASLAEHVKNGAVNGAGGAARYAATQFGEEAQHVYGRLSAGGARSARAVGRQIEQQPVASLIVAFAVGFLGGRLLVR